MEWMTGGLLQQHFLLFPNYIQNSDPNAQSSHHPGLDGLLDHGQWVSTRLMWHTYAWYWSYVTGTWIRRRVSWPPPHFFTYGPFLANYRRNVQRQFSKNIQKESHTHKTRDVENCIFHHDDRRPEVGIPIAASIGYWEDTQIQTPSLYSYWWGNQGLYPNQSW